MKYSMTIEVEFAANNTDAAIKSAYAMAKLLENNFRFDTQDAWIVGSVKEVKE